MIKIKIRKEDIKKKKQFYAPPPSPPQKSNLIDFMVFLQLNKIQLTAI